MKKESQSKALFIGASLFMLLIAASAQAQFLRTSYFMEGSPHRIQLNPALRPTKGFISAAVFNASVSSNALGSQDIIDVIGSNEDFYKNEKFLSKLKENNTLDTSINMDIVSFGLYKGKGFWSFNIGTRINANASVPKRMFEYMNEMDSENFEWNEAFDIKNQKINLSSHMELGVGYSHAITDRLTVGAKAKLLVGSARMKMEINEIYIGGNMPSREDLHNLTADELNKMSADIRVNARMENSLKGMEFKYDDEGYVEDLSMKGFGIAGYGGAIDLGVSYKLLDNLTVSASIIDLGFISWSKGSSRIAESNTNNHYDKNNYQEFYDLTEGEDVVDFDILRFKETQANKNYKTTLASTLVFGGGYTILNNKLTLGALSTTRFVKDDTQSELTLSANLRPMNWLNAAISYSMIQSAGKSIGAAIKAGPVMVGTDYIFLGNNTKCANVYLGFSMSLGSNK